MNGLQYIFEEFTRNEWIIIALLPLLLMANFALSRSVALSKNIHIKKYVATIDSERLASHIPSMKDVKVLQQPLKSEGLNHSSFTDQQAITFATGEKRKEKRSTVDIASIFNNKRSMLQDSYVAAFNLTIRKSCWFNILFSSFSHFFDKEHPGF